MSSNVMVGKWSLRMFKTQFNVFSVFQVYVSSCIFFSCVPSFALVTAFCARDERSDG